MTIFFLFSLQYSLDELHLDTESLFELVISDPQFEGLLPNLSHSAAVQAVAEAMRVLHNAPAPQVQWADFMSEAMSDAFCYLEFQHSDFSMVCRIICIHYKILLAQTSHPRLLVLVFWQRSSGSACFSITYK